MPLPPGFALNPLANTSIAVVAVNAVLTKAEAQRLAIMAQDGLTRAIRPIHMPFDGDSVFVLATGRVPLTGPAMLARLEHLAADTLARAVARGVFHAEGLGDRPGWKTGARRGAVPADTSWRSVAGEAGGSPHIRAPAACPLPQEAAIMPPGIRPLPRVAILAAALALAAPLAAQARGGSGGGGGGGHGGAGGFHGGGFNGGFGAMRGAGIPALHGGFTGAPGRHFGGVPHIGLRDRHAGLAFRLGNPVGLHSRNFLRSVPGIPPLRGTALPPLAGNPVPPLQGSFHGPEIWRRGQGGIWHRHLGFPNHARLSAGVLGFGVLAPVVGLPLVEAPYGTEGYGDTCNAEPYFCPIAPDAPIGTSCACPLEGGGLAPGWVE